MNNIRKTIAKKGHPKETYPKPNSKNVSNKRNEMRTIYKYINKCIAQCAGSG